MAITATLIFQGLNLRKWAIIVDSADVTLSTTLDIDLPDPLLVILTPITVYAGLPSGALWCAKIAGNSIAVKKDLNGAGGSNANPQMELTVISAQAPVLG